MIERNNTSDFFKKLNGLRIALYGIGRATEVFIEKIGPANIFGILDGYKTEGTIYGKRIIALSECVICGVEAIVICARKNSTGIISSRILSFCVAKGILLFDDKGNDLMAECGTERIDNEYFTVNEHDLLQQLRFHDVISFDVFDTLICRKVLYSTDIFFAVDVRAKELGALHFLENRIKLDDASRRLSEIYQELQDNDIISNASLKTLLEFEYEFDKKAIIKRQKMQNIYNAAKLMNKQIYIVSDTWYEKKQMEEILNANGFTGYTDVIVSCEYGKVKTNGLFGQLKEKTGHKTCIHIGDDYEADEIAPREFEIDTFIVKSPRDMLTISTYRNILRNDNTFANRVTIGLFASRVFNDPFSLHKSGGFASVHTPFSIGYLFVAPILSGFVTSLAKYAKNRCKRILFFSRDGFLPMRMYQMIECFQKDSFPGAVYFYTSRVACVSAVIRSKEDFDRYNATPFEDDDMRLLTKRFAFKPDFHSSECNFDSLIRNSKLLCDNYRKYAASINLTDALVVDFIAGGTCQALLSKVFDVNLKGYYFKRINEDEHLYLDVVSYMEDIDSFAEKIYLFIENVISIDEPSLKCFDSGGNPVFFEEKRSNKQLSEIKAVQEGILSYYYDYLTMVNINGVSNLDLCDSILSFIQKEYTNIQSLSLFCDEIFDEFTNRRFIPLNRN
ncbi:MAG: hypothetical protein LBS21_06150 [Clostridiales bacterium]|nr:hypothetical protein [Clostridiales bacterium]